MGVSVFGVGNHEFLDAVAPKTRELRGGRRDVWDRLRSSVLFQESIVGECVVEADSKGEKVDSLIDDAPIENLRRDEGSRASNTVTERGRFPRQKPEVDQGDIRDVERWGMVTLRV